MGEIQSSSQVSGELKEPVIWEVLALYVLVFVGIVVTGRILSPGSVPGIVRLLSRFSRPII